MKNLIYVQICDYIIANPRKSEANYIKEISKIVKDVSKDELKDILEFLSLKGVLSVQEKKFRQVRYNTYSVNLDKMDTFLNMLDKKKFHKSNEKSLLKAINALELNGVIVKQAYSKDELVSIISNIISDEELVGCENSKYLHHLGITNIINDERSGHYDAQDTFLMRNRKVIECRDLFFLDIYFSGVDFLAEDGTILKLSDNGSKIAPIFSGPNKVILLANGADIIKDSSNVVNCSGKVNGFSNCAILNKFEDNRVSLIISHY